MPYNQSIPAWSDFKSGKLLITSLMDIMTQAMTRCIVFRNWNIFINWKSLKSENKSGAFGCPYSSFGSLCFGSPSPQSLPWRASEKETAQAAGQSVGVGKKLDTEDAVVPTVQSLRRPLLSHIFSPAFNNVYNPCQIILYSSHVLKHTTKWLQPVNRVGISKPRDPPTRT